MGGLLVVKKYVSLIFISLFIVVLAACGDDGGDKDTAKALDEIIFADAGWDSMRVHNTIAQTIIEEGFGVDTDVMTGSTATTFQGLRNADIHVYMEAWTDNIKEIYEDALEAGDIVELGVNFNDNEQGLFVPAYVIEGDEERGIEPLAPDLRTVEDLKKYPEIFKDPEDPKKGRIINAPSGWEVSQYINQKFDTYGLDESFNNFMPGSDSAIIASLVDAYNKGEGWVGYYWAPTSVTAKYDLILLEEDPYDKETWEESAATEFPPNDVTIAVHKDLPEQAPEVVEFLSNYHTSAELTEAALLYMIEEDVDHEEAAHWWLQEYEDVWTEWVSEEVAEAVKESL